MSGIIIPMAEIAGGRAAAPRVIESGNGEAIAGFGERIAQIGSALEADRLDREMTRARLDIQRGLGTAAQEVGALGDPDAIDTGWAARSSALRAELLGRTDPKISERVGMAFDELSDRHALALGAHALDLRQSQRRALLDEQAVAYVSGAAAAEPGVRETAYDQLADSVAEGIASGALDPEDGARRLRDAKADGERTVVAGALDADPAKLLADLEKGAHPGLDPIYRQGVMSTARDRIAVDARARTAALGDRLTEIADIAGAGRTPADLSILQDPEAMANPRYGAAMAAVELLQEHAGLARMRVGELDQLIAVEKKRPLVRKWQGERLKVLEQTRDEVAAADKARQEALGTRLEEVGQIAGAGRLPADLSILQDPEAMAHPRYGETVAAVELLRDQAGLPRMRVGELDALIADEKGRPIVRKYQAERLKVLEQARDRAATGWSTDPIDYAAKAGLKVPALPNFDPANPEVFGDALKARAAYGQALAEEGYVKTAPLPLTLAEQKTLEAAAGVDADPATRAVLAREMARGLGRAGASRFTDDPVFGFMGGFLAAGGQPAVSVEVFRGEQAIANGTVKLPPEKDRLDPVFAEVGDLFASLPGGDRLQGQAMAAADALYAGRMRRTDPTGDIDSEAYAQALHEVLGGTGSGGDKRGGVQEVNGTMTALPAGVRARDVEGALERIAEKTVGSHLPAPDQEGLSAALARLSQSGRPPSVAGKPLRPSDLGYMGLRAVGDDRYALVFKDQVLADDAGRDFTFSLKALLREAGE